MSLIDLKVIDELVEWAKENEDREAFEQITDKMQSYYITRESEETYMMEYSVKTVADLKAALEKYIGAQMDQKLLKILAIEICRIRFENKLNSDRESDGMENNKREESKAELPEFIYIF